MTVIEDTRPAGVVELYEPGDHEKFSHVVVPASAVTEAYITGRPVRALCGKEWVPTRDPDAFPVCATCLEVLAAIRAAHPSA